jgi:hypothetical protein
MKTFKDFVEEKPTTEAVYSGMLGAVELFQDDKFLEWVEKLPMKILEKMSIFDVYQKYLKEKK